MGHRREEAIPSSTSAARAEVVAVASAADELAKGSAPKGVGFGFVPGGEGGAERGSTWSELGLGLGCGLRFGFGFEFGFRLGLGLGLRLGLGLGLGFGFGFGFGFGLGLGLGFGLGFGFGFGFGPRGAEPPRASAAAGAAGPG